MHQDFKSFFTSNHSEYTMYLLEKNWHNVFSIYNSLGIVCNGYMLAELFLLKIPWISEVLLELLLPLILFLGCKLWLLSAQFHYLYGEKRREREKKKTRSFVTSGFQIIQNHVWWRKIHYLSLHFWYETLL